jgi:hypothetical protein
LRIETVRHVVKVWNITFPGNRDRSEQDIIAAKFHQALSPEFNDEEFLDAARAVEKEVEFFPVIKNFMAVRDAVHSARRRRAALSTPALPEETGGFTPEEIAQNQRKVAIIRDMLAGKLSIDEAERMQAGLVSFAAKG